ncbi:MAG: YceI family protein [Xanthomonadaceae bacterium]|nr:YceI family protein [Xanthomonadaceae bacterium]
MKKLCLAVLVGTCCAAANAADTYTIDANHTHATFSFQHLGLSTFDGKIPAEGGTVVLDRAQKTGSVEVTFNVEGIATGVAKFDDHLRSGDFFQVDKFPKATFKSDKITFEGDEPATIAGNLTIKDITKPVTLKVTSFNCVPKHPMAGVPACGANATASINRSDFGLTYGAGAVPDEIKLVVEVEALQK